MDADRASPNRVLARDNWWEKTLESDTALKGYGRPRALPGLRNTVEG